MGAGRIEARTSWTAIIAMGVLTGALGCVEDGQTGASYQAWDSAGVRIVESTAPLWGDERPWTVAPEPELDIGGLSAEPEYDFYQILGLVRLPDGRIVVANRGTDEIRFYDSNGLYLSTSGGEGGGPGMYYGLQGLWLLGGDSLVAWDIYSVRTTILDSEGTYVRSWTPSIPGREASFRARTLCGDGSFLLGTRRDGPVIYGARRDSLLYHRFDRDGAFVDSVGRFPRSETYAVRGGSDGPAMRIFLFNLPFGRRTSDGPYGDGFFFASSMTYEIGIYSSAGELRRLVRRDTPNRKVTEEDVERLRTDWLEGARDEEDLRFTLETLEEMPIPSEMPAYNGALADLEGNLWVRDYQAAGTTVSTWSVFDSVGVWLGTVEIPPDLRVRQIGPDYILGTWRDDLDVEHVRLHRLVKE